MRKRSTLCLLALACLCSTTVQAITPSEQQAYLMRFAPLAIAEMQRFAIPASIKLAQSIVESNWGTSKLAREGNNYFGIKCKDWWDGETIREWDDDYDEQGQLMASCFRKYPNVAASFEDHSLFLLQDRYRILFTLDVRDYKGWAQGLQACGYATNPHYAELLIQTIETYQLYRYDEMALQANHMPSLSNQLATPPLAAQQDGATTLVHEERMSTQSRKPPKPQNTTWYHTQAIIQEVALIEAAPILP